jgi:hypothetical protein
MLNEITDDSQEIVDGLIYCHAPWSGYSVANLTRFASFVEKHQLSPAYWINVDHPLTLVQKIYAEGAINGYGEITVIRKGQIRAVVTYRDWNDDVGLEVLAAWNSQRDS